MELYRFAIQTRNPLAVGRWCHWATTTVPPLQRLTLKLIIVMTHSLLLQSYNIRLDDIRFDNTYWSNYIVVALITKSKYENKLYSYYRNVEKQVVTSIS